MLFSLLAGAAWLASSVSGQASSLKQVTVSPNPTGVGIYFYIPKNLASPPPLIVAAHYCTGTAQAYFSGTQYAALADTHGYIVIYPNAPTAGGCWDVATNATLTHNAGGDSLGIASAVRYAISNYGVDPTRVFVTGTSSGAMMTNVLAGAYPDLFAAGSVYSGVPYGCFEGPSAWNSQCADGQLIETPQQWGNLVRSGYPGYTGPRPKMLVWHGTADTTLYPQNFWEEIKQWTNVFGYSQTPLTNVTNDPQAAYSNSTFGPDFIAILAQGVGHTVPVHETYDLQWFGIDGLTPGPASSSVVVPPSGTPTTTPHPTTSYVPPPTPPPTSTPKPSSTSSAPVATQTHYGQCGGIGFVGPTTCAAPYTCKYSNAYYSQCL